MSFIIREKWIWIIIGACILAGVLPWVVVWLILAMPGIFGAIFVWTIIFSWSIAAGYKDWLVDRRKREKLAGLPDQKNWD
jgi:fatty acid desaturase